MRDQIKTEPYFDAFINEDKERMDNFRRHIERGNVSPGQMPAVRQTMHDLKLGILIARYSRGDEIKELCPIYIELAEEFQEVWDPDDYHKNLWMFSLAVLFHVDVHVTEMLRKFLVEYRIDDWLLHYLLNYLSGEAVTLKGNIWFPVPYRKLQAVILAEGEERSKKLEEYMKCDWYKGHSDCYWYNLHLNKERLYFGYWSFEAGAVAHILKIPDKSLKGVPYYPYDLVHNE